MKTTSLAKKELLVYALIAMPLAIVGLPLYIYLPTFYATDIGVNIALVGVFLFIARITDVLTDPYIGYLSDQSLKHFHSRKPIMYVGALILAVSFYLLIHPSLTHPTLWLFTFSILIYIGWSMVTIPYLTWSSEISEVYYHKTQLNSVREIATILGLVCALIVPYFFESSATQDKLNTLYFFFLLLFVPFFIITMLKIRIKVTQSSNSFSFKNIKKVYEIIPDLKNLQLGYFLNNLANAIPATLFLLFIEVVVEEKEFSEEILILYFVSGVIALPIWTLLSQKLGKKNGMDKFHDFGLIIVCFCDFFRGQ
jgi:Na+/melibiose symporter-like transporter